MRPTVPEKTRRHLEWGRVLERLAEHCRGPVAAHAARTLPFAEDGDELRDRLARVNEARALLDGRRYAPLGNPPDIDRPASLAARGGLLDPEDLVAIGAHLESAWRTRGFLAEVEHQAPTLAAVGEALVDLPDLARELLETFDERGDVVDSASGELGLLRTRVGHLHKQSIHGLLGGPEYADLLQDDYYTIREDRYVLPIKSGHKRHVPGIVHGWSASGATVYIEPQPVVEANNRLLMAQADVDREIRRVLLRLSKRVGQHAAAIRESQAALTLLDLSFAAGHLSVELKCTAPELAEPGDAFALRQARHPLLLLSEVAVIPNDILLDPGQRVLVVTGPNTGGKTVALKTVGLCALMTLAGLHIPAAERSRMPIYPGVFTDIGDEQSLDESTSTFSGHIANLKAILNDLRPNALVLLDELVVGTDPLQGAALAQAILEGLAARDTTVVVTTHYEPLKALPYDNPLFRNGAVGYDADAERPTYRLALDLPGASSALQTARRLGLDPSMVDRAAALAGPQQRHLESVIGRLEAELARVNREREQVERERRRLEVARTEVEATRDRLKARIKDVVHRERDEALRKARQAREEIDRLARDLRKPAHRKDADWLEAQKSAAQRVIEDAVKAEFAEREASAGPPTAVQDLRIGQRVWVLSLDNEGELLTLPDDKGRVEVRAGIMTARVDVSELRLRGLRDRKRAKQDRGPTVEPGGALAPAPAPKVEAFDWDNVPPQTPSNTVDVRGQRADEAIDAVERFLDSLYENDAPVAFIIHGHGTGALKREIRGWLSRCRYAVEHRRGLRHEGGDGVTAVRLA